MEFTTQEAHEMQTTTNSPDFQRGLQYGFGLAANCTDEQRDAELDDWRQMPYSEFADGVLTALARESR